MKVSELILKNIETNRKLIEDLTLKLESFIEMNDPKKKKKNNPKPKKEKVKPIKHDNSIDELIEIFKDKQEEAKEEKLVYKLNKELDLEPRKEKTIEELIMDIEEDKEKKEKPKPKFTGPKPKFTTPKPSK